MLGGSGPEKRSLSVFCTEMPDNARRLLGVSPFLAWSAVVAWMAVIFVLSSQPDLGSSGFGRFGFGISKVGHVVVFSALGFLAAHALDISRIRHRLWWTIVLVSLYAIIDEVHQFMVPGRSPALTDVMIDVISGAAGAVAWVRLARPFLAVRQWRRHEERRLTRASTTERRTTPDGSATDPIGDETSR